MAGEGSKEKTRALPVRLALSGGSEDFCETIFSCRSAESGIRRSCLWYADSKASQWEGQIQEDKTCALLLTIHLSGLSA